MKAAQSRNRQRKALYASLANKESRNQEQLTAPIIGHFETQIVKVGGKTISERVIVHADAPANTAHVSTKRSPNAQKRRRQLSAWARCRTKRDMGDHDFDGPRPNCRSCGCPESEAVR